VVEEDLTEAGGESGGHVRVKILVLPHHHLHQTVHLFTLVLLHTEHTHTQQLVDVFVLLVNFFFLWFASNFEIF